MTNGTGTMLHSRPTRRALRGRPASTLICPYVDVSPYGMRWISR